MSMMDLLLIAAVGLLCGLAGKLTSLDSPGGRMVYIIGGVAGAGGGAYLARRFHAPDIFNLKFDLTDFPILWSLIGSVLLVAFFGMFMKPGRR